MSEWKSSVPYANKLPTLGKQLPSALMQIGTFSCPGMDTSFSRSKPVGSMLADTPITVTSFLITMSCIVIFSSCCTFSSNGECIICLVNLHTVVLEGIGPVKCIGDTDRDLNILTKFAVLGAIWEHDHFALSVVKCKMSTDNYLLTSFHGNTRVLRLTYVTLFVTGLL